MRRSHAITICTVLLSACSGSHNLAEKQIAPTTTSRHAAVACDDAGTTATVRHLPSPTGSVWVWIDLVTRPSARVGSLVKVVWRVTGVGAPHALLSDPRGRVAKLTFGPDRHPNSTFDHPGSEYGTGFTPTAPGCWVLAMRRGEVEGSVSFAVIS